MAQTGNQFKLDIVFNFGSVFKPYGSSPPSNLILDLDLSGGCEPWLKPAIKSVLTLIHYPSRMVPTFYIVFDIEFDVEIGLNLPLNLILVLKSVAGHSNHICDHKSRKSIGLPGQF